MGMLDHELIPQRQEHKLKLGLSRSLSGHKIDNQIVNIISTEFNTNRLYLCFRTSLIGN